MYIFFALDKKRKNIGTYDGNSFKKTQRLSNKSGEECRAVMKEIDKLLEEGHIHRVDEINDEYSSSH